MFPGCIFTNSLLNEALGHNYLIRIIYKRMCKHIGSQPALIEFFWSQLINYEMRQNDLQRTFILLGKAIIFLIAAFYGSYLFKLETNPTMKPKSFNYLVKLFASPPILENYTVNMHVYFSNLCSLNFDLEKAFHLLNIAIENSPQYGDSYIELIRLKLMQEGNRADLSQIRLNCHAKKPYYGEIWTLSKTAPLMNHLEIFDNAVEMVKMNLTRFHHHYTAVGTNFLPEYYIELWQNLDSINYLILNSASVLKNRTFKRFKDSQIFTRHTLCRWILQIN